MASFSGGGHRYSCFAICDILSFLRSFFSCSCLFSKSHHAPQPRESQVLNKTAEAPVAEPPAQPAAPAVPPVDEPALKPESPIRIESEGEDDKGKVKGTFKDTARAL